MFVVPLPDGFEEIVFLVPVSCYRECPEFVPANKRGKMSNGQTG